MAYFVPSDYSCGNTVVDNSNEKGDQNRHFRSTLPENTIRFETSQDATPSFPYPNVITIFPSAALGTQSIVTAAMKNETDESRAESTIPRPNSLLIGPSSQVRAPSSLLSSALPRSLLKTTPLLSGPQALPLLRPRRLWLVQDNSLKRIPQGYPPLNPRCTTYVGDAPPSIVAVRIAECLRKRSISVEYDEETVSVRVLPSKLVGVALIWWGMRPCD